MPGTPRILSVLLAATVLAAGAPTVAAAAVPATATTWNLSEGADGATTPPPSEHPDKDTPWT
ncbi:hypothetical protein OG782_00750 [Streptomyces sp. NBC_00876]|uniref:hypothetical protein n=1 Tax=Streptomyces sp. NBC_00876 TaxID=2975853 RepID=UPI0038662441|nr:hypothetical protein OG782_00750 [Streptomyces sp. NBC_00876]